MIDLKNRWLQYEAANRKEVEACLEFDYNRRGLVALKQAIVQALVFWRFLFSLSKEISQGAKRNFLFGFLRHDNKFMRVVAMVESLPTKVWRRILWKYNIDFKSLESFLRRLTPEQYEAIEKNYDDLFILKVVPRVFSWWEKCFTLLTANKLIAQEDNRYLKYRSKGAWTYNLLGLDFGFSLYPRLDDDQKSRAKVSHFFSLKNHADDFVVNQENGKYWWLYRTARSNFVWFPCRTVKLKTHICPGFWYTLLIHLWFWVISPLATWIFSQIGPNLFAEVLTLWSTKSWTIVFPSAKLILLGSVASLTPLWCGTAVLKICIFILWYIVGGIINSISEKTKQNLEKRIENSKKTLVNFFENKLLVPIGITIVVLLISMFSTIAFQILSKWFNAFEAVLIITGLWSYIIYWAYLEYRPRLTDLPLYIKIPFGCSILSLLIRSLYAIYPYCQNIVLAYGRLLIQYPLLSISLVLYLVWITALGVLLFSPEEKTQKIFKKTRNALHSISLILMYSLILASLFYLAQYPIGTFYITLTLFMSLVGYLFFSFFLDALNPTLAEYEKINTKGIEFSPHTLYRLTQKNPWLASLPEEKQKKQLENAICFVTGKILYWCNSDLQWNFLKKLVPVMTPELLQELECPDYCSLNYKAKILALEYIRKGLSAPQAIEQAKLTLAKRKKKAQQIKTILKFIFFPILIINRLIRWLNELYKWAKILNKYCPYVERQKPLYKH